MIEAESLKGSLDTIKSLVRTRDYKKVAGLIEEIKGKLDEVKELKELEIYREFHKNVKDKIRNSGKSTVISVSAIDEEIIKTGNELEEIKNG